MKINFNKLAATFWFTALIITIGWGLSGNEVIAIICSMQALIMIVIVNQYVLLDKIGGKK